MNGGRTLAGEVVTFAGRLATLSRRQAFELVARHGGRAETERSDRTTLIVVGSDAPAAAVEPSGQSGPGGRTVRMCSEDEFCRLVGRVLPRDLKQQYYSLKTIRSLYPAVHDDHLRYLEKWGLFRSVVRTPSDTFYGFTDLAVIRQASAELQQGGSFRAVLRSLAAQQAGQLSLDFQREHASGGTATVVRLVAPPPRTRPVSAARLGTDTAPSPAEACFFEGERLDSREPVDVEAAMDAYRQALALDPTLVPAMINLGNLHYLLEEQAEAQAFYVQAAVVDPGCFEAHFNLGNVHHDCGRFDLAAACYAEALRLNPSYAEGHFYLAVTLEKMGRSKDARGHWRQYRALAPEGEWVELAKEFSE